MGRTKKYADLVHVDRLSQLPDEIILLILCFLDIKCVVQTATLSKRWRHFWKFVTHLNFDSYKFHTMPQFTKFVNYVLSQRNASSKVSSVELKFKGPATEPIIGSIVNYAYAYGVENLSFIWFTSKEHYFPTYLFKCSTLKHLTLSVYNRNVAGICHLPKLLWDFPALETLNLRGVRFHECEDKSVNLFSKCVNLKELTLHEFEMPLKTFTIYAPVLSSLTIGNCYYFPKVFDVVAPQLRYLTASIQSCLQIERGDYLQLSTVRFGSLEKVSLSKVDTRDYNYEKHVPRVLDLFEKLYSAKILKLDMNIIRILSSCEDYLLDHELCPFKNLTCLRVDATHMKAMEGVPMIDTRVRDYFLPNSSNSKFIMDAPPQVPQKRVQRQVHNQPTAKKRSKLDAENKQLETIDQEKKVLEVEIQRQDGVIADQNARIQMQDEVIAELKSKIAILEAAKAASSSSIHRTRSKRVIQPSKSSHE